MIFKAFKLVKIHLDAEKNVSKHLWLSKLLVFFKAFTSFPTFSYGFQNIFCSFNDFSSFHALFNCQGFLKLSPFFYSFHEFKLS